MTRRNESILLRDEAAVMLTTRLAGAALLLALAAGCGEAPTAPPPSPVAAPPVGPPPVPTAPARDTGNVTRVIDGDTFKVGPRTIRVLGIDACEVSTDAGAAATAQARSLLLAGPITLTAEPGVGTDRFDRELRYVTLSDGSDFGRTMVAATHTAVFEGENDASAAYVARLRAADPNARTCDQPEPVTTTEPKVDDETNVPDADAPNPDRPNRSGGGGRVGRDGDGDGLCNESTVPVPC